MYAGVCFEKGLAVALPENFPSNADATAEVHCGRLYRYENNADIAKGRLPFTTHNMFAYDGLYLAFSGNVLSVRAGDNATKSSL